MTLRDFETFDDKELKLGIARGLDMTLEKSCEIAEISMSTGNRWIVDDKLKRLIALTKTVVAQRTEKMTSEVVRTAQQRMMWVFDEAFKLTEKLIEKAKGRGDELTAEELMDIHKNITVWAAKYNVSEAPKRLESYNQNTHVHAHVIGFGDAENILRTRQMVDAAQSLPVIDVDPSDGNAN